MLQQSVLNHSALPPRAPSPMLTDLIAGARRSLEADPILARDYLDRIAALFSKTIDPFEAVLIPALPVVAGVEATKGGLTPWQISRVREHIDEKLEQTILVEALASVARLSSGHFCRAFKVSVGETPHAFLIRQRIRRAQTLMLRTTDNLSQIACACGLTDQAHLTRLFRRIVGETPLVWRRAWREG
jgi:AraC family transcriptional regulator